MLVAFSSISKYWLLSVFCKCVFSKVIWQIKERKKSQEKFRESVFHLFTKTKLTKLFDKKKLSRGQSRFTAYNCQKTCYFWLGIWPKKQVISFYIYIMLFLQKWNMATLQVCQDHLLWIRNHTLRQETLYRG